TAEMSLGGGDRKGKVRGAGELDEPGSVRPGELLPLRVAEDHRRALRDDGELFAGDRLPRVAEHGRVVARGGREDDDARSEGVRCVVPPSETRLAHGDV